MSAGPRSILFGTLAMNQTLFFEAVGEALGKAGHASAFICFHERSHEYLRQKGKRSFNVFESMDGADRLPDLSEYGWPSLNLVVSHEKAAFEIFDVDWLHGKLRGYLAAAEATLDALTGEGRTSVTVVQELGGFLSNIAGFYVARRRGLDNIFIEPSFFRGRVFFARNTFAAPRVAGPQSAGVSAAVKAYLDNAVVERKAVIPAKDSHHYRGPGAKLIDLGNLRRLAEKSIDRYMLGKREEFVHVGGHVRRHVRMFVNSRLLATAYQAMPSSCTRFIYYPLHVPADVALTIRSPQYVDQYSLIDFIARIVPHTHQVLIKEHPALVGAVNRRRILNVLKMHGHVRLLDPAINNYEVLARADAVVTVNSKSGAEALLLGRPVIVLGDAFYAPCHLVHRVESLGDLSAALSRILRTLVQVDRGAVYRYFQDVWDACWPGELYQLAPSNIEMFATSLLAYLEQDHS